LVETGLAQSVLGAAGDAASRVSTGKGCRGARKISRVGMEIPMKYVFWIAIVVAVVMAGWEILEPEITNIVFQDELHDTAAQAGARIGLLVPTSDEELRDIVIRKAEKHDIELDPRQVTVRSSGPPDHRVIYIAVDYTVPVNLLVYSFSLHFSPTSTGGRF
jgi:hypothetical protein